MRKTGQTVLLKGNFILRFGVARGGLDARKCTWRAMCLFVGHENSDPDQNSAAYEHMGGSRGGGRGSGPPPPPWKSQKYSFIAILGRIPWKSTRLPSQHSMLGQRNAAYCGIWILSPLQKNVVKVGPLLAKLSGSAHGTGSPLFAYRIMVYQNLNKKWKIPPNKISCQRPATRECKD